MKITSSQKQLLNKLHVSYQSNSDAVVPFEDFIFLACQKHINDLHPTDIGKVLSFTNSNNNPNALATANQVEYIKNIVNYLGITDTLQYINECLGTDHLSLNELTINNVSAIIAKIQAEGELFFPTRINLNRYTYTVTSRETGRGYLLMSQEFKDKHDELNMKLISFKNLLMCDWDGLSLAEIEDILVRVPYTFWIYETFNGYHGYCVSHPFEHYKFDTLQLMYKLKCDPVYISFTRVNGFVVRLSKKPGRHETQVEKFVKVVNESQSQCDPVLRNLVCIKDKLLEN
jgi:hypothetical protein